MHRSNAHSHGHIAESRTIARALALHVLRVVLLLGLAASSASADTFTWRVASGDWFTAGNWSPAGPPGAADTAVLNNGGTIMLGAAATVSSFTLSNGTLTGGGALTVTGAMTWTDGAMFNGNGRVKIASSATMTISGAVDHIISNFDIENAGTLRWIGGNIDGGSTTFTNLAGALFEIRTDGQMFVGGGAGSGVIPKRRHRSEAPDDRDNGDWRHTGLHPEQLGHRRHSDRHVGCRQ